MSQSKKESQDQISVEDLFNPGHKIGKDIIYSKPHWIKVPKKKLWCPYCNKVRAFPKDTKCGIRKCEVCKISGKDFYIKKMNHIWI